MARSDHPRGQLAYWEDLIPRCRDRDDFDTTLEAEIQTDKQLVKAVPCQFCKRPLIVTTFYVLAWAKCSPCKGETAGKREPGSVGQAQAGRTDPRLAASLVACLINPHFASALCPAHPDDPDHVMELKMVGHHDRYGPYEMRVENGKLIPVQTEKGETVMHQCLKCRATVAYSTTAQSQFRRINEPSSNIKHSNGWATTLGVRPEDIYDEGDTDEGYS